MRLVGEKRVTEAKPLTSTRDEDEAASRARSVRSAAQCRIMAGCAVCCGAIGLNSNGSEIICPRVARNQVDEGNREAVLACGIPALYKSAGSGESDPEKATEAVVADLVPVKPPVAVSV